VKAVLKSNAANPKIRAAASSIKTIVLRIILKYSRLNDFGLTKK
jgi:hypothetical protein